MRTLLILFTLNLLSLTAFAQNTAFTYQGRLNDNGAPANGVYDFTFQAFDAPTAGGGIGGTANVNAVGVSNGVFTALVDLGGSPFTGPARWLQISVSTNGAGSFTTLAPRQALTPSPYAIFAHTAGTVTNGAIGSTQLAANSVATGNIQNSAITAGKIAAGQVVKSLNGLTDAVSLTQGANVTINTVGNSLQISAPAGGLNLPFSGSASSSGSIFTLTNSGTGPAGVFLGNVGIGTTTPGAKLHANGSVFIGNNDGTARFRLSLGSSGGDYGSVAYGVRYRDLTDTYTYAVADTASMLRFDAGGFKFKTAPSGSVGAVVPFADRMTILQNGDVGIGTTTPQARLDVRGDIRLGPSGQFRATSGEENLRIIRGTVEFDGTILRGVGFSVSRISEGDYLITFTTPFSSAPSVTATVDDRAASLAVINFIVAGIFSASTSSVRIRTRIHSDADGVPTGADDRMFHFIAIGPR
jgi:hypothetical protein